MSAPRARSRGLAYALWAAFALLVVASAIVLLRACGLFMPALGWNFCPAAAPLPLSAEIERGETLSQLARQLELQLAEKTLACASLPPPQPPPLELPTERGPIRPQQTAELKPPPPPPSTPPKPPPPLPADRWEKKDLSLLKGCWTLGHETRTNLSRGGGGRVELCTVQAGTICFGENGQGQREQNSRCQSTGAYSCRAPITATFGDGGTLRTTQPQVNCNPSSITWNSTPNYLNCRRVNDSLAICRDTLNFEHEFRRKAGP